MKVQHLEALKFHVHPCLHMELVCRHHMSCLLAFPVGLQHFFGGKSPWKYLETHLVIFAEFDPVSKESMSFSSIPYALYHQNF
jgi:hypothetical protein